MNQRQTKEKKKKTNEHTEIYLAPKAFIVTNLEMHTTEYHRGIKLITTCLEAKQKNKLHFWCNFILVNDSNN